MRTHSYPPEYDAEPPCEVCGHFSEDCICPPCEICGSHGDPQCYRRKENGGHGMEKTPGQMIEYQKFRVKEAEYQWKEECQILDYLEEQHNRQGD